MNERALHIALVFMTVDDYAFVDRPQAEIWMSEAMEAYGDELHSYVGGAILYGSWLEVSSTDTLWEEYAKTTDRRLKWRLLGMLMNEKGDRGKE